MSISEKDEHMIALLRENGRMAVSEIARRLHVSRTAAQVRMEKLERTGVISGYGVRLSKSYTKHEIRALVMIKSPASSRASIEARLVKIPQLTSLYFISGVFDIAVIVATQSVEDLDVLIDRIGMLDGVKDTQSSIILSTKVDR